MCLLKRLENYVNPSRKFCQDLGWKRIKEKVIIIDDVELREIAYGWKDISLVLTQDSTG